ncbi:ribonuclease HII [Buchnera aphidicola (Formosaphis micheliae)]|uniref:ribonuclease HII n=1 Tax=Buchnera aphidicola TaxID=9 RepID=UPI0031CC5E19
MNGSYFPILNLAAGIDEVGLGALAGNVISAAVILNPLFPIFGLKDSKKLSFKKRLLFFHSIKNKAKAWSIGRSTSMEIDKLNVLQASLLSMQRAVNNLKVKPNFLFIDGKNKIDISIASISIVNGDNLINEISAASIVAKVIRDYEMLQLDKLFPQYGFAKHKGYPTKYHLDMLKKYGPISQHRFTFSSLIKLKNI